ncbi:hypothetical protein HWV62_29515 [Athelia sp. TMB]|nr:hypothetical protein HWV62_29515 [Athelia sp. TMB]
MSYLHMQTTASSAAQAPSISSARPRDIPLVSSAGPLASSACSGTLGNEDVDPAAQGGLRHSDHTLDASEYKSPTFSPKLLCILRTLNIPSWQEIDIEPSSVKLFKASGSLTNAVFFVSCPSLPRLPTLLLRIYGPSSGAFISRTRELHILRILQSSRYRIGPRVYGTFGNGRVEEYFDSTTLTAADMRDARVSRWIGARLCELHCVGIDAGDGASPFAKCASGGWEIGAEENVRAWIKPARELLALPAISDAVRADLDLEGFMVLWETYMRWLRELEKREGASKRVFAHNDLQYGNLLRLTQVPEGAPEHHQIIVIDLEYASINPAAFDIANHFTQWTANYQGAVRGMYDPARYPAPSARRNFYRGYLEAQLPEPPQLGAEGLERALERMEREVRVWGPATHAMWAVWGVARARDGVEGGDEAEAEFDYVGFAKCRMEIFRREVEALGVPLDG